jgi:glucosamine--fructose-6-phosphate aminotransferase (isomerizing)
MCGIVAAIGGRDIVPILIEGLRRLEYRGYDSAGLGLHTPSGLCCLHTLDRVNDLESRVMLQNTESRTGIAHTRWATHGVPTIVNAHPHLSSKNGKTLAVVHNGIIENFEILRNQLVNKGYIFNSETDTEVIAHLIHFCWTDDKTLFDSVKDAIRKLNGLFAIAVIDGNDDARIIGARCGAPLLVGIGDNEMFLASDVTALIAATHKVIYLEENDIVEIQRDGFAIVDSTGHQVSRSIHESDHTPTAIELGIYEHFMQKEIFEQPKAIAKTLEMALKSESIDSGIFGSEADEIFQYIEHIQILGCGSSYHAGLIARHWIEELANIPVSVEVSSEFRYRTSFTHPKTLIVTISQSGETADTIAALQYAKAKSNVETLTICNVPESSLIRESRLHFLTQAGPEIGVASTKTFSTQLTTLFLLALALAKIRGNLSGKAEREHIKALHHLPIAMQATLSLSTSLNNLAKKIADKHHVMFLGRGTHLPIAMEGALKLKEITYIHAEAYPAGELKHGPLALIDNNMLIVAVAPNNQLLGKLKSNFQEIRARQGQLYVFADQDIDISPTEGINVIEVNRRVGMLSPILHILPLQLLAYQVALVRGTDVDKPRNLAKSVTVE